MALEKFEILDKSELSKIDGGALWGQIWTGIGGVVAAATLITIAATAPVSVPVAAALSVGYTALQSSSLIVIATGIANKKV